MGEIGKIPPSKSEKLATPDINQPSNQLEKIEPIVYHCATQNIITEDLCFKDDSINFTIITPVIFIAEIVQQ